MKQSLRLAQRPIRGLLGAGFLIPVVILSMFTIWQTAFTSSVGENDFVGYWSATYLISNGQNPYDPELMKTIQNIKIETNPVSTIMAWNPPTLFVILLPLAGLPFLQAKSIWLVVNLAIIISTSLILANLYGPAKNTKFILFNLFFALIFPPIISGLYMGQVTFLVLFGLTLSMALIKRGAWFQAGMVLILTTIKPHLVVLPMIYLFAHMALKGQFKGWIGFLSSGILCIGTLNFLRPEWIKDLIGLSMIAPVNWATPTIGGLLSSLRITENARYLIVLFMPLPFWLAWQHQKFSVEFSTALLTLITIPVTFFGWNYDQSLLLIPIAQVFGWMLQSRRTLLKALTIVAVGISIIINGYLRLLSVNDMFFVWVPLFWWVIFTLMWHYQSPLIGLVKPHD